MSSVRDSIAKENAKDSVYRPRAVRERLEQQAEADATGRDPSTDTGSAPFAPSSGRQTTAPGTVSGTTTNTGDKS